MTQKELLLDLFRRSGNQLTLGDILRYPFGYEMRARFTELRKKGYVISCEINRKDPSKNLYTILEPEKSGQMKLC